MHLVFTSSPLSLFFCCLSACVCVCHRNDETGRVRAWSARSPELRSGRVPQEQRHSIPGQSPWRCLDLVVHVNVTSHRQEQQKIYRSRTWRQKSAVIHCKFFSLMLLSFIHKNTCSSWSALFLSTNLYLDANKNKAGCTTIGTHQPASPASSVNRTPEQM